PSADRSEQERTGDGGGRKPASPNAEHGSQELEIKKSRRRSRDFCFSRTGCGEQPLLFRHPPGRATRGTSCRRWTRLARERRGLWLRSTGLAVRHWGTGSCDGSLRG